jgi:hypothetical protein
MANRTYHYYCADATTRLQFAYPRIDLVDGTEPSIQELVTNSPSMVRDTSGYGNHHYIAGYYTPVSRSPNKIALDGSTQSINKAGALNGATTTCSVVIWYSSTDTQELWVEGQNTTYYLAASASNNYYHSNVGTPTNYVDLAATVRPDTPINYRNGAYHMWEAKGVDFTTFTQFQWFGYPGGWQMAGNVSRIQVFNRVLTATESAQIFNAHRGRYGI